MCDKDVYQSYGYKPDGRVVITEYCNDPGAFLCDPDQAARCEQLRKRRLREIGAYFAMALFLIVTVVTLGVIAADQGPAFKTTADYQKSRQELEALKIELEKIKEGSAGASGGWPWSRK